MTMPIISPELARELGPPSPRRREWVALGGTFRRIPAELTRDDVRAILRADRKARVKANKRKQDAKGQVR